jgi:PAS domain S-box-containing protein
MTAEDHGSDPWDVVSEARGAVVEALPLGVIVLDSEARVLDVNPAAQQILGGPAVEAIGRPVAELLSDWTDLSDLLVEAAEQKAEVVVDGDSHGRVFEVRVSPLHGGDGRRLGRLLLLRDVTERKRVERELRRAKEAAEASDRAKSEFMSVASHEMRTPITSIKGYTDLLSKGTVGSINEQQARFLDTIRTNADRVALLVSDLSDMARIESGRLRLEIGVVEIEDVVEEAVKGLRTQIEEKDQTLRVTVADDLSPARADRERAVQVLSNLMSNAHKFTPAGGTIAVRAEGWEGEGRRAAVLITVEDDGIGIRPEEQEKVFERFYRSDDRKASDAPGSGLGLSIAASLVEMQGGEIWLESVFREGTVVRFTLPAAAR